jgi:hypothetical protein
MCHGRLSMLGVKLILCRIGNHRCDKRRNFLLFSPLFHLPMMFGKTAFVLPQVKPWRFLRHAASRPAKPP